jgi:type IV secretion system protein VirD4
LEQKVCILDPYNEVGLEPSLKARYNPLDIIDIEGDLAVADAGRIAAAIVIRDNKNDPYWEEAARNLVKGLILHVLTWWTFEGMRNLVTVQRLLTQGDWLGIQLMREAGEKNIPPAFGTLWSNMRRTIHATPGRHRDRIPADRTDIHGITAGS